MDNALLLKLLEKSLAYTPIVYKQSSFSTNQEQFNNVYEIEAKYTEIPDDCLLFFLPSVSSNESGSCILKIKVPTVSNNTTVYKSHEYKILVEQNTNTPRYAQKNDIIANRICIFRFRKSSSQAILINSPLYNDAIFSNIKVTNAEFLNPPIIVDQQNPNIQYTLVTIKELQELKNDIAMLKGRIIFGTDDPEEALKDSPSGTIYIQHEED